MTPPGVPPVGYGDGTGTLLQPGYVPQNWEGFISYVQFFMSLMDQVFKHLFQISADLSQRMAFLQADDVYTDPLKLEPSKGQWMVLGNIPHMSDKGEEIVAAVMTIIHNGIVFVAQFTTLLPYEPLSAVGP